MAQLASGRTGPATATGRAEVKAQLNEAMAQMYDAARNVLALGARESQRNRLQRQDRDAVTQHRALARRERSFRRRSGSFGEAITTLEPLLQKAPKLDERTPRCARCTWVAPTRSTSFVTMPTRCRMPTAIALDDSRGPRI